MQKLDETALVVTVMTSPTSDGRQAGTDRCRRTIVVGIDGGEISEQGGVARFGLVSCVARLVLGALFFGNNPLVLVRKQLFFSLWA